MTRAAGGRTRTGTVGRPALVAALLASVLLASGLLASGLLAGCAVRTVGREVPAPPVPPSSSAPSATAPETAPDASTAERALPLYYVVDTPAGLRLAREFRRVAVEGDAGSAAVAALLAAPTGTVPGHRNVWPRGSATASPVRHADGVVTVDLTRAAVATVPDAPELAVQQLVHTVTGALGTSDPVRLLVAGRPVARLWGRIDTSAPVARADPYSVRVLVGIDEPAEGATAASPLRIEGEAAVFEATLLWEIRRDGAVVRSGATRTTEGQRFAPYSFTVALPPGEYEIRVAEDDPSDGAGRPVMTDTRRVTVTT